MMRVILAVLQALLDTGEVAMTMERRAA